jgi:two-component system response regulator HydG
MQASTALLAGSSARFKAFLSELERAARSDATVLLQGESGTGKSAAARALHAASARATGPFVTAGLAALSPQLIESELFGHEAGAFTDAKRTRAGLFRRAQGGTLLLDEVDLLPLELQVKLLRALQERVVEPLGAEQPVPIDVRVVAACARPLDRERDAGRFRPDLYWRLAVVVLELPPLRARVSDLSVLCNALLARAAERSGAPARPISAAALERLALHSWPGNVRELENALERALALAEPQQAALEPQDFAFLDEGRTGKAQEWARAALAQGLQVRELEEALIAESLREQRGNLSAAARQLGLTRRALEYRRPAEEGEPRT